MDKRNNFISTNIETTSSSTTDNLTGFTIIEVALVLGLAGLIFTMVFLILPTLWAAERDSERRDNVLTFIDTLKNFQSNNNRGALPSGNDGTISYDSIKNIEMNDTSWEGFYKNYLLNFEDPLDGNYNLHIMTCKQNKEPLVFDNPCNASITEDEVVNNYGYGDLHIIIGATCDGSTAVASANKRKVAVLHKLEGSNGVYCANS